MRLLPALLLLLLPACDTSATAPPHPSRDLAIVFAPDPPDLRTDDIPTPATNTCGDFDPSCDQVLYGPGATPFDARRPDGGVTGPSLDGVVLDAYGDATLPPGATSGTLRVRQRGCRAEDGYTMWHVVDVLAARPGASGVAARVRYAKDALGSSWSASSPPIRTFPFDVFTVTGPEPVYDLDLELELTGSDGARPVVQRLVIAWKCPLFGAGARADQRESR